MYDIVRLRNFAQFCLINPPDLPDSDYRDRLRDALRLYRAKKGKRIGWSWIIKNELPKCLTDDEKNHPACQVYLDVEICRARLERWCPKLDRGPDGEPVLRQCDQPEGWDTRDPRLVLLAERFLKRFAPALLGLSLPSDEFLMQGRTIASFLSETPQKHREMDYHRATEIQQRGQGRPLLPGKYQLAWPDYISIADYVRPYYLSVIDVGEKAFYKVILISFTSELYPLIISSRSSGYLLRYTTKPTIMLRGSDDSTWIVRAVILSSDEFPLGTRYFATLIADTFLLNFPHVLQKVRWLTADVYDFPHDNHPVSALLDSLSHEVYSNANNT